MTVKMMGKVETKATVKTTVKDGNEKDDDKKTMQMDNYDQEDSSLLLAGGISLPQFPIIARAPALTSSAAEMLMEEAVDRNGLAPLDVVDGAVQGEALFEGRG